MNALHTTFVAIALCAFAGYAAAQSVAQTPAPVSTASPTASPAPVPLKPEDYAGKSFDELLKIEEFGTAYRTVMLKTPLARAAWPYRDAGWAVSKLVLGPHNRQVVVTGTCSSRKCDLNKVQAFFDPISKKMYAHLTLGNKAAWLGKTDTFEKRTLEPLLQARELPPSSIK
jgi:hypothetical protein